MVSLWVTGIIEKTYWANYVQPTHFPHVAVETLVCLFPQPRQFILFQAQSISRYSSDLPRTTRQVIDTVEL